jgi:hypothetical protein
VQGFGIDHQHLDTAQRSNPLLKGINLINKIALAPYRTRGRALAARRTLKAGRRGPVHRSC